jgi:hypothetical protein
MTAAKKILDVSEIDTEEVKTDIVSFEFDGKTYEFDKELIAEDIDILEAFEDGKLITPLKLILGLKQWNAFRAHSKPNAAKLGEFAEALFEVMGVTPGE